MTRKRYDLHYRLFLQGKESATMLITYIKELQGHYTDKQPNRAERRAAEFTPEQRAIARKTAMALKQINERLAA